MSEVATAFVSLIPQMKSRDVSNAVGSAVDKGKYDKPGSKIGSTISKGVTKTFKWGMAAAGAAGATALWKGFGRLKALDDAKAKLDGLGYSGAEIDKIMEHTTNSVKGTAFGLGSAATVATLALGSGVKSGQELEDVLTTVADTAAFAGTDMESMGAIFGKVAARGKVQGTELQQLAASGVPALQFLADELGVTSEEVSEMVSKGEVDFKTFRSALDEGLGGSALAAGDTFSGALDNVGAAMGRLGASVLSGAFPAMRDVMDDSIEGLDSLGPAAERAGEISGRAFGWAAEKVGDFIRDFAAGEGVAGTIRSALESVADVIATKVIPMVTKVAGWVSKNRELMIALGSGILFAVAAYKAYRIVQSVIKWTKALRATMLALNAAFWANPIFILIGAFALATAAIVYLYRNNETARKVIDAAWAKIKEAISAVVDWFRDTAWPTIQKVIGWITGAFGKIRGAFSAVVGWFRDTALPAMRSVLDAIGEKVLSIADFFKRVGARIGRILGRWFDMLMLPFKAAYIGWDITIHALIYIVRKVGQKVRKIWAKVQGYLRKPVNAAINWITKNIEKIRVKFRKIRDRIRRIWTAMQALLRKPIDAAIKWITKHIEKIRRKFRSIRDRISKAWSALRERLKKPVRAGAKWVMDKASDIRKRFVSVRDKIGRAWAKIKGKLVKPVKDAIKWINKNLIGSASTRGFNWLLAEIGTDYRVGKIPTKGWATGGWTGPGSRYEPAGVVHADEFVVSKPSRRKFERENPGVLDHINRYGRMPGYAKGGLVIDSMRKWLNKNLPGVSITSGLRPGARTASGNLSNHAQGKALDLAPSMATFNAIRKAFGSSIKELIYSPAGGRQIKNGKPFRYGEPVKSMHYDHVHWAMDNMKGGGGGFWSGLFNSLKGGVKWIGGKASDLLKKVPGSGLIPPLVKALGKKAVTALKDKAKDLLKSMFSFGGGGGGRDVSEWSGLVQQALKIEGLPLSLTATTLRRMRQESGGDPRALNDWDSNARRGTPSKGLMQVIDPTFRAYAHPKYSRNIWDPLSNILAAIRYSRARYGSVGAGFNRAGGYADGGRVKPLLFDKGGYLPEGISVVENRTGAPEPLMRLNGSGGMTFNLIDADGVLIGTMRGVAQDEAAYAATIGRQY